MKKLTLVTDPVFQKSRKSTTEEYLVQFIRDERDLPFVKLIIRISITLVPLAVLLYLPFVTGWLWIVIAVLYHYYNNIIYKGPFGLMLHCTSHRVLFKQKHHKLNYIIPWFLAPFFGHSPETYYAHHIGMHHAENNLEDDDSSTMPYQRDSLKGFLKYFGNFLVIGMYNLAMYFYRRHRKKLFYKTVRGELLFIFFCTALCFVNAPATIVVFIIPYILYRLIAFIGNWAQHAFIGADEPFNSYKNSVTCINTPYNHKCWNDGYHISHHIKPAMHWTEHPLYFQKTIDEYAKQDAIVFDGIHFLHIFFYLMRKRYDLLAFHFVNVGNRYKNDEEVIAMLKERTRPVPF
ncbi:MAG: fatty acid desaturase [Bacteroidota bacterium]